MHKFSRLLAIIAMLMPALASWAEEADSLGLTAASCFKVAPTTVLTMIDKPTRLDMLDYFDAGVDRPSGNELGGECYIVSESPYRLKFVGGTDIEYEIFVLNPMSLSPVIGVIETVATPIPDSTLKLYDRRWNPAAVQAPTPVLADWIKADAAKRRSQIEQELPFIMSTYSYDDATGTLIITNNMDQYFVPSDTPQAMDLVKDKLSYTWTGKQFKLQK